jgi:tetratricopeptide (TPR) repeat protein
MAWVSNLFKKKFLNSNIIINDLPEGYKSFEKGKELFFNGGGGTNNCIHYFDEAIQNGFTGKTGEVYDLRAACLQELGFHYDAIDDFDKAVVVSPKDCNRYFCRSVSKAAIDDYSGQIIDLEKAIELSLEDNELNRGYNYAAEVMGNKNGVTGTYKMALITAKMGAASHLEFEEMYRKTELNGTLEEKEKLKERRFKNKKNIERRQ